MPGIVIGLVLVVSCICFPLIYLFKNGGTENIAKNRGLTLIFVLSFISLVISVKIFWNTAIYVDDFGASPTSVYGSDFWLSMAWLRLGLLTMITFISGIKLFSK
ncbi:hypothetical protein [Bacillus haikouensis]|jgi:hypothetical protein|uniref:hypothetical protein n=1 Tax=Bacillus haikouensis TaxID=1510468 RepID=UPI001FE448E4|nr:hypothetical protein [Bacillus haikouensis]